jgi:hypothetical protein
LHVSPHFGKLNLSPDAKPVLGKWLFVIHFVRLNKNALYITDPQRKQGKRQKLT